MDKREKIANEMIECGFLNEKNKEQFLNLQVIMTEEEAFIYWDNILYGDKQ